MCERAKEQYEDIFNTTKVSHMREHIRSSHPQHLTNALNMFTIKVIKNCRTALNHQVREAVELAIDNSHEILNSKEEYNSCSLPSKTFQGPLLSRSRRRQTKEPNIN